MADERLLHTLGERIKELTALHRTARILQDEQKAASDVLWEILSFLPEAWQYPEHTAARIRIGNEEYCTSNFKATQWIQSAVIPTRSGETGAIDICYLKALPTESEGPFLAEERDLIESLAEMLGSYLRHKQADQNLQLAHDTLEQQVRDRTFELSRTNAALMQQIEELKRAEERICASQEQLSILASELTLTEARERRAIASDLHDHIGQALAYIRLRVAEFQGNAVFCGFEQYLDEIVDLLDKAIKYTRSLTVEISPPVLYELGLVAALEWMADQFQRKHNLIVKFQGRKIKYQLSEELQVFLFKSVQELLTNVVKHSHATNAEIELRLEDNQIMIEVADNGAGFDPQTREHSSDRKDVFGLFSVKERLRYLKGDMRIQSQSGKGTKVLLVAPLNSVISRKEEV